jgi:hypothetical protein
MKPIKRFFKKHHALLTIPTAILLFALSIPVLRWFDPEAGIFDAGKFQFIIMPIIMLLSFLAVTWIIFGLVFGTFKTYLMTTMKSDFNDLEKWQRIKLVYYTFFFLLAALVVLAKIVS